MLAHLKMSFTLFEKYKWKNNDLRSRSRNENEIKKLWDRDQKWNLSRIKKKQILNPGIIFLGFFTLLEWLNFSWILVSNFTLIFSRKGVNFFFFILFEKRKWNKNDWKSRSRSESEIKMTRDREVKYKKNLSQVTGTQPVWVYHEKFNIV